MADNHQENISIQAPVSGEIIQGFGGRPDIYARFGLRGHNGLDYACPVGTPVFAAASGTVTKIQTDPDGYGLHVRLTHPWGRTIYAHLSEVTCRLGQIAPAGALIARSGDSGFSDCPHLHFEVRQNGLEGNGYNGALDPILLFSSQSNNEPQEAIIQESPVTPIFSDEPLGESNLDSIGTFEVVYPLGLNVRALPDKNSLDLFDLENGRQVRAVSEQTDAQGNRWVGFVVWCAVKHSGTDLMKSVEDEN